MQHKRPTIKGCLYWISNLEKENREIAKKLFNVDLDSETKDFYNRQIRDNLIRINTLKEIIGE